MTQRRSVSISNLARYASDPNSIFKKSNQEALRYGTKAHNAIGQGPSLVLFVVIALALIVFAFWKGLI
jgi:hypothetical protein